MSFDFPDGGAGTQTSHHRDQVFGVNLALLLLVIQGKALFELCQRKREESKSLQMIQQMSFSSQQQIKLMSKCPKMLLKRKQMKKTRELVSKKLQRRRTIDLNWSEEFSLWCERTPVSKRCCDQNT